MPARRIRGIPDTLVRTELICRAEPVLKAFATFTLQHFAILTGRTIETNNRLIQRHNKRHRDTPSNEPVRASASVQSCTTQTCSEDEVSPGAANLQSSIVTEYGADNTSMDVSMDDADMDSCLNDIVHGGVDISMDDVEELGTDDTCIESYLVEEVEGGNTCLGRCIVRELGASETCVESCTVMELEIGVEQSRSGVAEVETWTQICDADARMDERSQRGADHDPIDE